MSSNFDILHTHAMGRIAKEVRLASIRKNIPYAISFHGGNYDVPKSEFDEMAKPLSGSIGYGRAVEKILGLDCDIVAEADGIICVGDNELSEIKKRFPNKRAVTIPNGVSVKKFDAKVSANFRAAYSIPADRKLILCVSRIDYQKNQLALVELVKRLSDENVHCAIVGFVTSQSYYGKVREAVSKAGLADRFTFVEGLPPDSDMLVSAYSSADMFALPSVHEPFGIVALEAWSARIPLIAARVGGLKTLVKDGYTGFLFDPNSPEQMLDAYRKADANRDNLVVSARRLAENSYSWEAVAAKLKNFYTELVNAKKRR